MTSTLDTTAQRLRQSKQKMIDRHLKGRDIADPRVLRAMETVPRERFVTPDTRQVAYNDTPLPIGHGQTISQPYIVALMAQTLAAGPDHRVLEVGAGCGYQAAVLSQMAKWVFTVEIIDELALQAEETLQALGYSNVTVIRGDGAHGWPKKAPYDRIIAAAVAPKTPKALEEQLAEGGRIVIPLGDSNLQKLMLGVKSGGKVEYQMLTYVRFVPMTGAAR